MGASIYLVSACSSGEEFVAAFRRYADKNGLFIPISEPLAPGGRGRFALTLRDGGVMVEGEAEIVSSARTPSVLHGRVGMTLRFVEPDEASRTTLGELEKARLAMRPQPPSVPARPAEIPAEPRPVLPPIQGRIDAVNALAECVAIGDTTALGPPLPAALPKAGQKFVAPSPGGRSAPASSPPAGLAVASRASSGARPATAPLPIVLTRPDDRTLPGIRDAAPPAVTPRATPQPDRLRPTGTEPEAARPSITGTSQTLMAATPIAPGPTSDTMVAAAAPADGPISTTMTAVPAPSAIPPSAPTEIGGPLAVPAGADDDPSAKTQVHAGAPAPPAAEAATTTSAPPEAPALPVTLTTLRRSADPAQTLSDTLRDDQPVRLGPSVTARRAAAQTPPAPAALAATPSEASPVPVPPAAPPSAELPAVEPARAQDDLAARPSQEPPERPERPERHDRPDSSDDRITAAVPAAAPEPVGAQISDAVTMLGMPPLPRPPASPRVDIEVEIGEPTDISLPPEPPTPEIPPSIQSEVPPPDDDIASPPGDIAAADDGDEPQEIVVPAAGAPASEAMSAEDEPDAARPRRTVIGVAVTPLGVMKLPATPTLPMMPVARDAAHAPPGAQALGPAVDPLGDGTIDTAARTIPAEAGLTAEAPRLDEQTPSEPWPGASSAPASPPPAAPPAPVPQPASSSLPSGDWLIARDPEAPDGWSAPFETVPRPVVDSPRPPPPVAAASAAPIEAGAPRPSPRPGEVPIVEPKVQIDPTLIESPHAAGEPHGRTASSPEMAMYAESRPAMEAPALQMMMAMPQPGVFAPHGPPPPGYAAEPGYPAMPVGIPPSPPPHLRTPAGGSFPDPRYASSVTLPVAGGRRRRLVIVLVTALVAVLIGIAAMLMISQRGVPVRSSGASPSEQTPAAAPPGPAAPPASAAAAPTAPSTDSTPAAATGSAAPGPASADRPPECFADVRSQPAGADIVIDQTTVIGTTPQRVSLPCGREVELVIRKPRLVQVARAVTPTPEGAPVQVTLGGQSVPVKVSSTPPGATVTLNGKSLGVTPTIVKLPAFETSMLVIARDGYEPESEKVTPKAGGATVHSALKKLERKKPR